MLLYSGPLSLFSKKIEIALAEKGLAFERVLVPFTQTRGYEPRHPAVLAANPKGQVPVLVDDELTLYDSTVILEYLDEAYPTPPLYPKSPAERARVRVLDLEADEVLLEPIRKLMFRTEPPGSDRARREEQALLAYPHIVKSLSRIETALEGRTFLADDFSVADIATFMTVHWYLRLGGPGLGEMPNLNRWYITLASRPAFAKAAAELAAADRELSHPVPNAFQGVSNT
ncbi:MAG: glutathione S-transferase family protein [Rhizobiales bacterium]|nr:glutathione S-transferase family protein [Hyphomicrobiales bacterium]